METISKVKNVQGAGTWDSEQYGTLYKFDYEFEDGTTLRAMHKSQKHFNVGEDAAYEITKDHPEYGKSGKVKKPKTEFNGKGDLKGIKVGHALNCASVIHTGNPDRDLIKKTAKMIYELSEELNSEL